MSKQDARARFGVTGEQLAAWEAEAAQGIVPGKAAGAVMAGRPLMFGEATQQVGFREPKSKVRIIDQRARSLGMGRSDYLRFLVDQDLDLAGLAPATS